jgi:hypothetical protein
MTLQSCKIPLFVLQTNCKVGPKEVDGQDSQSSVNNLRPNQQMRIFVDNGLYIIAYL